MVVPSLGRDFIKDKKEGSSLFTEQLDEGRKIERSLWRVPEKVQFRVGLLASITRFLKWWKIFSSIHQELYFLNLQTDRPYNSKLYEFEQWVYFIDDALFNSGMWCF